MEKDRVQIEKNPLVDLCFDNTWIVPQPRKEDFAHLKRMRVTLVCCCTFPRRVILYSSLISKYNYLQTFLSHNTTEQGGDFIITFPVTLQKSEGSSLESAAFSCPADQMLSERPFCWGSSAISQGLAVVGVGLTPLACDRLNWSLNCPTNRPSLRYLRQMSSPFPLHNIFLTAIRRPTVTCTG